MTGRAWFVLGLGLGSLVPAVASIITNRIAGRYVV